jgi:hypothetical protein
VARDAAYVKNAVKVDDKRLQDAGAVHALGEQVLSHHLCTQQVRRKHHAQVVRAHPVLVLVLCHQSQELRPSATVIHRSVSVRRGGA